MFGKAGPGETELREKLISLIKKIDKKKFDIFYTALKLDRRNPEDIERLRNFMILWSEKGSSKDIISLCEKILLLYPENLKYHLALATAYFMSEDYDRAIDVIRPKFEGYSTGEYKELILFFLMKLYSNKGNYKEAIKLAENYLKGKDKAIEPNLEKLQPEELIVKEGLREDSGMGRVRMDSKVAKILKLQIGDIVEIFHPISKSKTAALLFPRIKKDRGTSIIRLDPFLMRNIDALFDDLVKVRKIKAPLAEKVYFANIKELITFNPKQLNTLLENRVVTVSDILSFSSYNRIDDMRVVDIYPRTDVARIGLNTKLCISDIPHSKFNSLQKEILKLLSYSYNQIGEFNKSIEKS